MITDELLTRVTLDTASSQRSAAAATKRTMELVASLEQVKKTYRLAEMTVKQSAASAGQLTAANGQLVGSYQQVAAGVSQVTAVFVEETRSLQALNVAASEHTQSLSTQSKAYAEMTNGVTKARTAIVDITTVVNNLTNVFVQLTDEKNLTRIANLLRIFGALAGIKGHEKLADGMKNVADKVEFARDLIHRFKDTADDDFQTVATVAEQVATGFHLLKVGALVATAGLVTLAISVKVISSMFPEMGRTVGGVFQAFGGLKNSAEAAISAIEKINSLHSVVAQIEAMGAGISTVGKEAIELSKDTQQLSKMLTAGAVQVRSISRSLFNLGTEFDDAAATMVGFGAKLEAIPFLQFTRIGELASTGLGHLAGFLELVADRFFSLANAGTTAASFIETFAKDLPSTAALLEKAGMLIDGFGDIIRSLAVDLRNIPGILKALGSQTANVAGEFGKAVGLISGMTYGMAGLGVVLLKTESTFGRIAGGVMIALAASMGGILIVVKTLTSAIGELIAEAGEHLFTFFDKGLPAAIADEVAIEKLTQAIQLLSGGVEQAKPILASWDDILRELAQTSVLAGSEAQALIVSVARMGQEFRLTQAQQQGVVRSIAAFAKTGEEASQMAYAIRAAFQGQGKEAEELGLHLNDLALKNSAYVKGLHKGVDELTTTQKVQGRLNLLFAQAAVAQATLANSGEALATIQHRVQVAQSELSSEFAQSSIPLYKLMAQAQLAFLNTIRSFPQGLKNAINSITSYAGALLIAVGEVVKWSFTLAGGIGLVTTLNALIKASAVLQTVLSAAFTLTNVAMGGQAIVVKSLKDVLVGLITVLRSGLILSLQAVGVALLDAAKGMATFTLAVLRNPLFWKAAVIAVGITAIIMATRELFQELGFLKSGLDDAGKALSGLDKAGGSFKAVMEDIKDFASEALDVLKELAKFILAGLVADFLFAAKAIALVRQKFSDSKDEAKKFQDTIDGIDKKIQNIGRVEQSVLTKLADHFSSAARAAEKTATSVTKADNAIGRFTDFINAIKNAPLDEAALRAEVLGDEFTRAGAAAQKAGMEYSRQVDKAGNLETRTQEDLEKTIHLREEAVKAQLGMTKVVSDAVIKLRNDEAQAIAETLKNQGKLMAAAQLEADQKVKEFDRQYKAILNVRTAQDGQLSVAQRLRQALIEQGKAQVEAAKLDELKRQLDLQKKVSDRSEAGLRRALELRGNELDQIRLRGAEEIMATHQLMEEIKAAKDLSVAQKAVALASLEQTQAEEGKLILLTLQKAALDKLKEINDETLGLAREFVQIGMDEAKQVAFQSQLQADILRDKRKQLALDAEINAAAIGAINAQLNLLEIVTKERVFQIQLKETSDLGQMLGRNVQAFGEDLNTAISALGGVFGVNLPLMSQELIHAMALGTARFVSSFEGAFSTTGLFIGASITTAMNLGAKVLDGVFGTSIGEFSNAIGETLAGIAGTIGAVVDDMVPVIQGLFDPETIQGIADGIREVIEQLPRALMRAFDSLQAALMKIIDKLPQIVGQLFDNLNVIVQKIVDSLPKVIDKLAEALGSFLDRLPELVNRIVDALPGIIEKLLTKLPDLIIKLFGAVGKIIAEIVKVIPDIIVSILNHLPDIVEAIINGLLSAMGEIAAAFIDWFVSGGAERMVGALLRAIPKLVVAIVSGIVAGLRNALGSIFRGIKAPDALNELPEKFAEGLKNLAAKVTEESSQLFKVLDLQAAAHGLDAAKAIQDAVDSATTRLATSFRGLIDGLLGAWRWVYDHVIGPLIEGLTAAWRWVYDHVVSPLIEGLTAAWRWVYDNVVEPLVNGIREVWRWVYENTIEPAINGIREVWRWVYDNLIAPSIEMTREVWRWVNDNVIQPSIQMTREVWRWVNDNVITPFITGLSAAWLWVKTNIVDAFVAGVLKAFGWVQTNIVDAFVAGVLKAFAWVQTNIVDAFAAGVLKAFAWVQTNIVEAFAAGVLKAFAWVQTNIVDKFASGLQKVGDWFQANVIDKLKIPDMPAWMKNFSSFKIPDLPNWMRDFSSFKIPNMPKWMSGFAAFEIPDMPEWMTGFAAFKIPDMPAWMDTGALGGNMAIAFSNKLGTFWEDFGNIGVKMATGFWNKLTSFDFGSLTGGSGGLHFGATGGAVTATGIKYLAAGGPARGSDTVAAMLTPGEFVVAKPQVDLLGGARGVREALAAAAGGGRPTRSGDIKTEIVVHINFSGMPSEDFVKSSVIPQVKKELKAASQRGDFLMSAKGLR